MFQHDRHEYTRGKSFTFPYIASVLEGPLLLTAECQGRRRKLLDSRINNNGPN